MPLFNDLGGFSNTCMLDMVEIVRCDGGFGDTVVTGDTTVRQFTYSPSLSGTSQTRIAALVGIGSNIVLGAVGAGFVLPDGTPITAAAGVTFPPDAAGVIRILYDVQSAYFVFASDGSQISFPRTVCLYHELAHAFHIANGTLDTANPEFQAETDENGFRAQVGLTLRDPNNHAGGLGAGNGQVVPSCSGVDSGGGSGGGCFVASAAAGSPEAPQVVRLKSARDALMAGSPAFGAIAGRTLAEYYGFSPFIALDMRRDPALREAVNAWFVRPLSHFDGVIAAFLASGGDAGATVRELGRRVRAWESATPALPEIAAAAAGLVARLEAGAPGGAAAPPADP
ncbi:M91 family zinc metallopeptidase, partial [uncultured Amaricoccus sp.]|uniref:M91 family zinc metallopeptidase n=1 Tax=uncultured Amaricoccus sp. TaxID=339341 RepID=UPI00260DA768